MRTPLIGAMAALALAASACSSANSPNAAKAEAKTDVGYTCSTKECPTTLTADLAGGNTTFVQNFNPFSPTATPGTFFIYEPLFTFNVLKSGEFIPWLAKSFEWSPDGKTFTMKLDEKAKWSDGSPVTADDVVFTFEQTSKDPETKKFDFQTVTAKDPQTVEVTFDKPGFTLQSTIGGMEIVPKKIWEGQDLKTWTNPEPVASGPYTVGKFSSQQIELQARPDYWKQKVPVPTIKIPILGEAKDQELFSGQLEWDGGAIANVDKVYVAKNPEFFKAWYPSYGTKNVFYNANRKPFDDPNVRRGLSKAINGERIAKVVTQDLTYPISPTGMDQKTQGKWIADEYKDLSFGKPDQAGALAELAKSGYTKKGNQLVGPDGKQLSVEIIENAEYRDAVQYDQLIADDWKAIGVAAKVLPVPGTQLDEAKKSGDFDVNVGGAVFYDNPWGYYNDILNSENAGTWANYGGWKDPATDALLKELAGTGDEDEQRQVIAKLQKLMVEQVPSFPVTSIGASTQYNTENWVGWPSEENPYAMPPPWASPDNLRVVLSLKPNPKVYGD